MNRMNRKQWVIIVIWFIAYIAALQFFRFKFGLFTISGVAVVVGTILMWLFRTKIHPKSN